MNHAHFDVTGNKQTEASLLACVFYLCVSSEPFSLNGNRALFTFDFDSTHCSRFSVCVSTNFDFVLSKLTLVVVAALWNWGAVGASLFAERVSEQQELIISYGLSVLLSFDIGQNSRTVDQLLTESGHSNSKFKQSYSGSIEVFNWKVTYSKWHTTYISTYMSICVYINCICQFVVLLCSIERLKAELKFTSAMRTEVNSQHLPNAN